VVVGAARYPRISHGSNMGVIMQPNGTKSESGPDLSLAVRTLLSGGFILRVCANRRVAYVSRGSQKAVQSL
jgi:hypothetical protein